MERSTVLLLLAVILLIRPIPCDPYYSQTTGVGYPVVYQSPNAHFSESYELESRNRSCGIVPAVNYHNHELKSGRSPYGKHPWQAAILDECDKFICAGALIHHDYIITAACCVRKMAAKQLRVRLGDWDVLSNDHPEEAYHVFQTHVSNIYIHPGSPSYDDEFSYNVYDIALVQLSQSVDLDLFPQVSPVCLPESRHNRFSEKEEDCWVAGWSSTQVFFWNNNVKRYSRPLMESPVEKVDKYTCSRQGFNFGYHRIYHGYTCRIGAGGSDVCVADKGSPVVCYLPVREESYQHPRGYESKREVYESPEGTSPNNNPFRVAPVPPEPLKKKAVLVEMVAYPSLCSKRFDYAPAEQKPAITVAVADVVEWILQVIHNHDYYDMYYV